MPRYLVAIHHPDNYNPSLEGEDMVRDIDMLNEEMEAAGARLFAGGLESAPHAKSLRKKPGGEVVITDGPYLESKEHIGGFWILDAANMDEAVAWDAKPSSPAAHRSRCASSSRCQQNRNAKTQMRKLKIMEHISLDGVIRTSGEDSAFPNGDWTAPSRAPAGRKAVFAAHAGSVVPGPILVERRAGSFVRKPAGQPPNTSFKWFQSSGSARATTRPWQEDLRPSAEQGHIEESL